MLARNLDADGREELDDWLAEDATPIPETADDKALRAAQVNNMARSFAAAHQRK